MRVRLAPSAAKYELRRNVSNETVRVVAPAIVGGGGASILVRGHRRGQLLPRCRPNAELFILRDASGQTTLPLVETEVFIIANTTAAREGWIVNRTRHRGESTSAVSVAAYSEMFAVMSGN